MKKFLSLLMMALLCVTTAWATETLCYTLSGNVSTGGNSAPHNSYGAAAESTQDGITWSVMGNSNQTPWRIGGKNLDHVERPICSETPMGSAISKVEIEIGSISSSLEINEIMLIVANDKDFVNIIETTSKDNNFSANSTIEFAPSTLAEWPSGAYYRIVFKVTNNTGSNYYVQFNSAKFYKNEVDVPTLYLIGNSWNGASDWDVSTGSLMSYDSSTGRYSTTIYMDQTNNYFQFAQGLGSSANDWGGLTNRIYPSTDWGTNVDVNNYDMDGTVPLKLTGDDTNASFWAPPGIYTISVELGDSYNCYVEQKEINVTLTPDGGKVALNSTATVSSTNLYSLLHGIKSSITQSDISYATSTDGSTYTDGATYQFSTAGTVTLYGKASYGKIEQESEPYSFTVANFYDITCAVVTDPAEKTGGTITADPVTASAGDPVILTITTKAGYVFDGLKVDGSNITPLPAANADGVIEYSFEMQDHAIEAIAHFTAKTLNITVNNDDAKGVVSEIPATSTVSSPITFTVAPHTGYTINSVTYTFTPANGSANTTTLTAGENNTYSFNMPGYDVTIDVTYDEEQQGQPGQLTDLFHETFGENTSSAREWKDEYSVKSGVSAVYSNIGSYIITNAKQSKNTMGYNNTSGLQSTTVNNIGQQASIIMGPLNVADYKDLQLTYYWRAGSINATYNTKASYSTSENGTYTEVTGTGSNAQATNFVPRTFNLPEAAQVSTLYLKIEFYTSNANACIDEVNLRGTAKKAKLKLAQIEETNPTGEVTIADDLQVVAIVDKEIDENTTIQVAFARDFAESINPASCPDGAVDFMRDMVYTEADLQAGPWQQNNWVMLDFTNVATTQFGALSENCVIKGGTLTGTYSDYTFQVSDDFTYQAGTAVGNYTPNVYCPANFHSSNTQTINVKIDGETVERTFWFMTPKPMEVCKFTWAMYYNGNGYAEGFYMQDGDVKLLGGVGVDQTYNSDQTTLVNGESYRFTGVIMKTGQTSGAKDAAENHHPQDGSTLNTGYIVAPTNLTKAEGQVITAVNEVKTGGEVVSVTYCDLAGRMSQKPFAGVNIIVTRYSDGTVKTTKAIK